MLSQLFSSTAIPVLEQAVNFAQSRHKILASNIANFDTPGYRTRDLSQAAFEQRLQRAIKQRDSSGASLGTSIAKGDPFREVNRDLESILYHDDSNVAIEKQIAEVAKNQMRHSLALSIMNNQFQLLQAAIAERA